MATMPRSGWGCCVRSYGSWGRRPIERSGPGGGKLQSMSRVEEIEAAISSLPPEEFRLIVQRVRELEQARWDEQMDRDSSTGKLDSLFDESDRESAQGLLREWPPSPSLPDGSGIDSTRFRKTFRN